MWVAHAKTGRAGTMTDIALSTDPLLQRYLDDCLATAYVPLVSEAVNAAEQMDLQLRHARDAVAEVADDQAGERLVAAIRDVGHGIGRSCVAVVGGERTWVWPSAIQVDTASAVPGPLPSLARLIADRQSWISHAVVEVDKIGADLTIVDARTSQEDVSVDGADSHITKSKPGGWSQRRFQQRAEEHWEDNMRKVADRLAAEVRDSGIELVMVTGGDQVISILRDVLPPEIADGVIDLGVGGRADDGSDDQLDEVVDKTVRHEAAARRMAAQESVLAASAAGNGVTGRKDVLRSLFEGVADTVVIHLAATEGLHAVVGDEPRQVAADASTLQDLGLNATRVPLVDAVLRGAAASGCGVVVLPADETSEVEDGLAASLRR